MKVYLASPFFSVLNPMCFAIMLVQIFKQVELKIFLFIKAAVLHIERLEGMQGYYIKARLKLDQHIINKVI